MTRITGTLHKDQYIFLTISRSFLLRVSNSLDIILENTTIHGLGSATFFENRAVCEIKWNNVAKANKSQMIWRMSIACWISKAVNTQSEYAVLIVFHCNNGNTNASECYVIRIL